MGKTSAARQGRSARPASSPEPADAPEPTASPAGPSTATPAKIDVKALRQRLGAFEGQRISQEAFGKLLGVWGLTVRNWEHGKPISGANYPKLVELAAKLEADEAKLAKGPDDVAKLEADEVKLAEVLPVAGGRAAPSTKTTSATANAAMKIIGEAPIFYANVIEIVRGENDAVIRFGLVLPGGTARAVAEVVVPVTLPFESMRARTAGRLPSR